MKIQTITHATARRNGKPVKTYKIRYEEAVRDSATGQPTGAKRSRSETYPTYDAADARRREIEGERAATGTVVGREARLEPFGVFAGAWLRSLDVRIQRGRLKARTRDEYARILDCYLLPEFGAVPIGSLSPERMEAFAVRLLTGRPGVRPIGPATFKHIWHVFGRVLKYAVRKKAIPTNPLDHTEIEGGYANGDGADLFTPHPLTAEQVGEIATSIEKRYPVYGLVILFLAYSGLRAAELAGLEVGDVSLSPSAPDRAARGTVRVARTKRRRGGEWIVGTPKSRKSRRTVPLDGWLVDLLKVYLKDHPRADDPSAPLFPNRRKGGAPGPRALDWASPVEPGALYDGVFKPALRAAGLPVSTPATDDAPAVAGVRLHDLRHSFAVMSLSAGEHYMMVSKWLGHANFTITLNVYGDYIPEDEGGKAAPLAAPARPVQADADTASNVLAFRRRTGS